MEFLARKSARDYSTALDLIRTRAEPFVYRTYSKLPGFLFIFICHYNIHHKSVPLYSFDSGWVNRSHLSILLFPSIMQPNACSIKKIKDDMSQPPSSSGDSGDAPRRQNDLPPEVLDIIIPALQVGGISGKFFHLCVGQLLPPTSTRANISHVMALSKPRLNSS